MYLKIEIMNRDSYLAKMTDAEKDKLIKELYEKLAQQKGMILMLIQQNPKYKRDK